MKKQSELNIGMIGHVDHGKTTLTKALTGIWTDTHSEELKRGITIKLGYADLEIYKCKECGKYSNKKQCDCGGEGELVRKLSFIDAPGHESLMATVISASSLMDGAILVIAANEKCPQPQTAEHYMVLKSLGIEKILVVQNKVDLVSKERALENYKEIREFLKDDSIPIIPVSATYGINIDVLLEYLYKYFQPRERDPNKKPKGYIIRSFDVNKPGEEIKNLKGGVIGGSLIQGVLKKGDIIEIVPGFREEGKYYRLKTKVVSLHAGKEALEEAYPGGLIGIETELDPYLTKSDSLAGNVFGIDLEGEITNKIKIKYSLFDRDFEINLKTGDALMIGIGSSINLGIIKELKNDEMVLELRLLSYVEDKQIISLTKRIDNRWKVIGKGEIILK